MVGHSCTVVEKIQLKSTDFDNKRILIERQALSKLGDIIESDLL